MLVRNPGERHFTRRFDGGSFSHRVILPGRDLSRVKVTEFTGCKGGKFAEVSYPVEETVRITRGRVRITTSTNIWETMAGATYYVPAGEVYSIEFKEETEAVCFFSQAADGTLPANEADPNDPDAPPCTTCGSIMVRSGSGWKCPNCGETTGCA